VIQAIRRWLQPAAPPEAGARGRGRPRAREIRQSRERVSGRVEDLEALTERELLSCGRVLASIVDEVREIIADADRCLAARWRARKVDLRFIREMRADIQAQEAAVDGVLSSPTACRAIDSINGLSQYSSLLAINSRIEAAHRRTGARFRGHLRPHARAEQDHSRLPTR
jgi:hypothetical protein